MVVGQHLINLKTEKGKKVMSNILDLLKLNLLNYQNTVESHGMKLGIQICLDEINKISNDVEEVVRCKDCKHLVEIDDIGNLYVCDRIDIGMDGEPSFLSPENDFCSYGERRETK